MGRLSRLISWVVPLLLAIIVLFGIHSRVIAAPAPPTASELALYLETHTLDVGVHESDGYQQLFYTYKGEEIALTASQYNHTNPTASGQNIAWEGSVNGSGQIFIYDVVSEVLTQITASGNNESPYLNRGIVTWQSWDGAEWQIQYYDGYRVTQITDSTTSSVYASSDGQQIIYAQQLEPNRWRAQSYDIASRETTVIREGDQASTAFPHFNSDGTISTAFVPR